MLTHILLSYASTGCTTNPTDANPNGYV